MRFANTNTCRAPIALLPMELTVQPIRVRNLALQVAQAGPVNGPLGIVLHGFPDAWWGFTPQIEALAARGFHVVAPNQRGYGESDKPQGIAAYHLDELAADVLALADTLGAQTFCLAGHDWGGLVAWWVATFHPHRVARLAILNAPHPDTFRRYVARHPSQMRRSLYAAFFQLPRVPERVLIARHFALLRRTMLSSALPGTFSNADMERYCEDWARPGALTGMLGYYRALRFLPRRVPRRVTPPTLLIWGERDAFLELGLARASLRRCQNGRALWLPGAGHWVMREAAPEVNRALGAFFEGDSP